MSKEFDDSEEVREATKDKFKAVKEMRDSVPKEGGHFQLNQEWAEYNLKQWNIILNGNFTGSRLTEYKGRKCAITSEHYKLIPNEKVTEIGETVMMKHPEWGLTPDTSQSIGKWNVQNGNIVESTATKYNPSGTSIFAKYRFPTNIDPTGDGREMHLGLAVQNSIDLSRGFSIVPYHWRSGCMNSMFHVRQAQVTKEGELIWQKAGSVSEWDTYGESNDPNLAAGIQNLKDAEDHLGETAGGMDRLQRTMRHTDRLTESFIIEMFEHGMSVVSNVAKAYAELARLKTNKVIADQIANSKLPKRLKNNIEGFTWVPAEDKDGNAKFAGGQPVYEGKFEVLEGKTEDQWQVYNQATDILSHGSLSFNGTLQSMSVLDRIFLDQAKVAKVMIG